MRISLAGIDNERLRVILGFFLGFYLLTIFAALALAIALGKVEAATSYGLGMILGGLNTAIGAFAIWAWHVPARKKSGEETEDFAASTEVKPESP